MKILITFIALLIGINTNAQQSLKTDSVYITGKIGKFAAFKEKANSLKIVINDLAFGKQLNYLAAINDDGTYKLSFLKTSTQDIMLIYNNQLELVLVTPGEHMNIDFDADDLGSMKFAGDGVKVNQELRDYKNAIYNDATLGYQGNRDERYKQMAKSEKDNEPEAHKKFLTERYTKENNFLTNYLAQNKLSQTSIQWATMDLKYEYLNNLMRYIWMHPIHNNINAESFKVADDYFNFINQADLNNTEAAVTSNFGDYVGEYGRYIARNTLGASYIVDKQIDLYVKEAPGLGRDIILSNLLYNLTQSGALDLVKNSLDKYKAAVQQPVFKARVIKAYDDKVYALNNYTLPANAKINNVPKTIADKVFDKILAQYAGKVVYVDFWATWCGPCRAEMPNSKILHKKLADKDVVFLYLGVQSEEKVWKAAIAEMDMEGEHFLLSNNDFNAISAKFQINGIPRYILVDKKGEVVNGDAMRPGNEQLKSEIEKLLASK